MALPGAVKTKANKRSTDRVFQKRQSAAQKAGTKAAIKYGPYVIGGVGGLGIKAIATMLAGTGLKAATKAGLKKAAQKYFGKSKVDDAFKTATKKVTKKPTTTAAKKPTTTATKEAPKKVEIKPTSGAKVKVTRQAEKPKEAPKKVESKKVDVKSTGGAKVKVTRQAEKPKPTTTAAKQPTTAAKKPTTAAKKPDAAAASKGKSMAGPLIGTTLAASAAALGTGGDQRSKDKEQRIKRENVKGRSGASRTARPSGRTDSPTVGKEQKERQAKLPPREGMGGKATVSPEQKSRQATLPRDSREDQIGVRIARMLGDKRSVSQMIRDREESEAMEEEMNFRKGGAVSKKYGMRAGGFTKRGGLYKKGY